MDRSRRSPLLRRIFLVGMLLSSISAARAAEPTFERDVLPILNAHCLQCHGGLHQNGKLDLRTLASIKTGGKEGPAIVSAAPEKSPLWQRVASDEMPPRPIKVSAEQKAILRRWIQSGAPSAGVAPGLAVPSKTRATEELAAAIDREIDSRLAVEKIPASPLADDGKFLRRIYLDVHGRIPTRAQAEAFLSSTEPNKRQRLIESLLGDSAYGDYWARLWRDRVAVPVAAGDALRSNHTQAFQTWLADGFNKSRPWNELVREMITAEGDSPAVAFIRQCMDDGQPRAGRLAASTAKRFLGVQLQCAECHDHPFTTWKQDDFWGLAAFFSRTTSVEKNKTETRTGIYDTEKGPATTRFGLKPLVRKDSGAVLLPEDAGPRAGKLVAAKFLEGGPVALPEKLSDKETPRRVLADWLTSPKNAMFARATANRLWAQVFGRGLVEPVDSLDAENLPSHPALLNDLAGELVASGYDVKHLLRGMLLSRAYHRTHRTIAGNESDRSLYSHATIKSIKPEAFFDCLVIASGNESKDRKSSMAVGGRAAKGEVLVNRAEFLKLFKTDDIDGNPTEYTHGIPQVLALLNERSTNVVNKLVDQAMKEKGKDDEIVSRIYIGVLSRRPTSEELSIVRDYLGRQPNAPARFQAVWWALVNSPEFAVIP